MYVEYNDQISSMKKNSISSLPEVKNCLYLILLAFLQNKYRETVQDHSYLGLPFIIFTSRA